jgi:ABC-type dipeptide/oligopeptide/nickel transport system permease component
VLVYVGRRLLLALPALLGAVTLAFLLIRAAPGDPVDIMLGPRASGASQAALTAGQRAELRRRFGLDQPLPVQYAGWLGRVLRGDLGTSIRSRRPVGDELRQRLPATLALTAGALTVNVLAVLSLGLLSAVAAGRLPDHAVRVLSLGLVAVPPFWLGLLLLWLFAVRLQWVTVAGAATPARLILPALVLGLSLSPRGIRVLRASLLEVRSRAHVQYARAKGLPARDVWLSHTLRLALLPVVTLLSLNLVGLLTGSVVAESVFAWPGIGLYVVDAIFVRDYPVVQGFILVMTVLAVLGSLIADVLYVALDPRVRSGPAGP